MSNSAGPVRFSLFEWLDLSGRDQGDTYEERLQMLEYADEAGFYCYHLAEHHASELSTVPSPNLFLSAVAQRTSRLRLGPLGYVLPLYDPVRLMEEICMLDQLSKGRLEIGLSRGSTGERRDDAGTIERELFLEALDVILMGLRTGEVTYSGKHFQYAGVRSVLRPRQKPYPPMWYPTSNIDSIPWAAAQGFHAMFSVNLSPNFEHTIEMLRRARVEYEAHASDPNRINGHVAEHFQGFSMMVHVADTDERAKDEMRTAYAAWHHNFVNRFVLKGETYRYATSANFDEQVAKGKILVGSPDTVRRQLQDYLSRADANYFIGTFSMGSYPQEQIMRSMKLFATEVMPAISGVGAR